MESLIKLFKEIAPLSPQLEDYLRSILKPKTVSRKEIIMREGDIARYIYFIKKGLIRSYYWVEGNEVCSWFMKEGDVFVSVQSFFMQVPSLETIEAMEDGVILGISYEQLQYAYSNFIEFNIHRGVILEKYYSISERRHFMTRRQSMRKRYENLLANEAELLIRVPAKYLASYLGMTESHFSHMRSEYAGAQKPNKLP